MTGERCFPTAARAICSSTSATSKRSWCSSPTAAAAVGLEHHDLLLVADVLEQIARAAVGKHRSPVMQQPGPQNVPAEYLPLVGIEILGRELGIGQDRKSVV